ncbi:NAD(P)-dependent oxidoreductase [Novisyntrophococcus fermenticellae]|uniref:NAD(P)-dependent oxidoreductase n=1 Tax=Novisyntrophococcus fermenticellae TaxID=2068655 RepID=UPI001E3F1C1F|nr:NAD(P)-dependent oxidoreductase [Novisyntrophococcus fermenticellae]
MEVITYDPYVNEEYCNEHHIKSLSIQELYKKSDAISLHLPLNDETRHIDGEAIEYMKEGVMRSDFIAKERECKIKCVS